MRRQPGQHHQPKSRLAPLSNERGNSLVWLGGPSDDLESRAKWAIWVLVGQVLSFEVSR